MKKNKRLRKSPIVLSDSERKKRKREVIIIVLVVAVVAVLTFIENKVIYFGGEFPISNTILMFILININLLLLILLLFLVLRNLVKLLYDRKRKVMGAKLRARLVMAFVALSLLPTIVLFFFSISFITNSIEFWFNVPVEQALANSIQVGRRLYKYVEDHNQFFLERIAYQIEKRSLLEPGKKNSLDNYIQVVQRAFNLQGVEVYSVDKSTMNVRRLTFAFTDELKKNAIQQLAFETLYQVAESGGVRSISERGPAGELTRTIGTVPLNAPMSDVGAFVVLSKLIPHYLTENMESISRGFEEYQQRKMLKEPLRITVYITISLVASLVLFCAIWFGFVLAKTITIPIKELAEGTRRVAEGDLSFSIPSVGDDEIGSLVDSFNRMTRDLRTGREQVELSAQILRKQNVEIEKRRRYMEIVLENVSTGVITLDEKGDIITMNKSAEKMLHIRSDDILKQSYKTFLNGLHLNLARDIVGRLAGAENDSIEFPLRVAIKGIPRVFIIRVSALKDDRGSHMGIVAVFDDLTDLEKAQRMAAWREVARRIAHEVKNPLTPIKLSAQRLDRKYSQRLNDKVFKECIDMIIDHVDLIRNLVNEFSAFARFPSANPAPCDLQPIIEETLALYKEGHPGIHFHIDMPEKPLTLSIDRRQIKQAMINLVDNAISAIKGNGEISINVAQDPAGKCVRIEVADSGPGIPDESKARLFEPYFSTKKSGMGLGLTIVSSIIGDHNGKVGIQDNQPQGAKFVIELPI